jgi:4-amino-4-deoxy-L-arabinose transferase-like glycosyltransferase
VQIYRGFESPPLRHLKTIQGRHCLQTTTAMPASAAPALAPKAMLLLWLLMTALWFGSLGMRDLVGTDEGRYSEIAREMAQTGDFVTPRLNGLKYFEKPALQYWMTALSFKAFGESDFVARLWTGLSGFLSVLMVWYTARRLWNQQTAQYAALVTVSMVWMFGVAHVVTVDMSVSFFLTLALCGFLIAQDDRTPDHSRRRWMLGVWAAMAGGVLSKGLIGAVIPGAALFFYSLTYRDWKPWTRMQWLLGPLVFVALAAPWFVLVCQRNPEFFQFFFIHEHFERFATTEHRRVGAWYYFVPILVGGLLPWASLLPQLTRYALRKEDAAVFQHNRLLLVWCGFIFLFFSASGSKLPGYILPMFPALGLLIARMLVAASPKLLRVHGWIIAALWFAVICYAPVFYNSSSGRMPVEFNQAFTLWAVGAALIMLVCALLAARSAKQQDKNAAVVWMGGGGLLMAVVLMMGYQVFSPMVSAKNAAEILKPYLKADTELFSVGQYEQTLPFYLKHTMTLVSYTDEFDLGQKAEPEKWIPTLEAFPARWQAAPSALALVNPDLLVSLERMGVPMVVLHRDARRVLIRKP